MIDGLDKVIDNLKKFEEDFAKRGEEAMQYEMQRLENWAKSNRPWVDQTGNARAGLRGTAERTADGVRGVIAHTVVYGPRLENDFGGRYAILRPAALEFKLENIAKILRI